VNAGSLGVGDALERYGEGRGVEWLVAEGPACNHYEGRAEQ